MTAITKKIHVYKSNCNLLQIDFCYKGHCSSICITDRNYRYRSRIRRPNKTLTNHVLSNTNFHKHKDHRCHLIFEGNS